MHLIFMAHSPSHDLINHRVQFSKQVITMLWQRQKKIQFLWGPVSAYEHISCCMLRSCSRHCSRCRLQQPVTQIRGSAVISNLDFLSGEKKSQSLCQHWSWFTWTLAQKILISSCPVLFNLDINLCLSSFDKVNSAVIVVKGNLFLGEKNLMHFDGILKNKQKSQIELLSELTRLKF